MPWANNSTIDSLRMQYNAALSAHRDRHRAVIEARMQGSLSPALVENETRARQHLEEIRANLLAAMTRAIIGDDPPP